jgi:hypothetical protein
VRNGRNGKKKYKNSGHPENHENSGNLEKIKWPQARRYASPKAPTSRITETKKSWTG